MAGRSDVATPPATAIWLQLTLESDATFGRGDGVAGGVDAEVQHDAYGLPFLGGRTLKGLLRAECAEVLYALRLTRLEVAKWEQAAAFLFGAPGSRDEAGHLRVGDARLPADLRLAVARDFDSIPDSNRRDAEWGQRWRCNLEALTTLRRQTAMDHATGAPLKNTLRTMRVILRQTPFVARLDFTAEPSDAARWLLAAGARALHRAGTGRNRGRGLLTTELWDGDPYPSEPGPAGALILAAWLDQFEQEVRRAGAHLPGASA